MESIPFSPNYTYCFNFERNFNTSQRQRELHDVIHLPYTVSLLYVLLVFGGRQLMRNRSPYRLKMLLVVWNAALCLFSTMGSVRLLPELVHVLRTYGFGFSVCQRSGFIHNPIFSCWSYLFTVSKLLELADTAFVVLRKQDLRFIHWFHHAATLIITWHGFVEFVGFSRYFVTMNFVIHSIMYGYFAVRAAGYRMPKWVSMFITSWQIIQMFIGSAVSYYSLYSLLSGGTCHVSMGLSLAFCALYSFYVYLFLSFFVTSYLGKLPKTISARILPKNKQN